MVTMAKGGALMKCSNCNGAGKRFVPTNKNAITGNGYTADCLFCNGTGEIEVTNEEWFCQLPTEEKAKWLSRHSRFIYGCGQKGQIPKALYEEDWEYWLKGKNHE